MAKEQAIYQIWWDQADNLSAAFKNVQPGWRFHKIDLSVLANQGWEVVDMKPVSLTSAVYVLVEREQRKPKEFDDDPPDGSKR